MPHVMIYAAFRKVREPVTHVVSQDQDLLQQLGAHPFKSGLSASLSGLMSTSGASPDMVIDGPPMAVLDMLEKLGFNVIGSSSFDESYGNSNGKVYCTWTLKK